MLEQTRNRKKSLQKKNFHLGQKISMFSSPMRKWLSVSSQSHSLENHFPSHIIQPGQQPAIIQSNHPQWTSMCRHRTTQCERRDKHSIQVCLQHPWLGSKWNAPSGWSQAKSIFMNSQRLKGNIIPVQDKRCHSGWAFSWSYNFLKKMHKGCLTTFSNEYAKDVM